MVVNNPEWKWTMPLEVIPRYSWFWLGSSCPDHPDTIVCMYTYEGVIWIFQRLLYFVHDFGMSRGNLEGTWQSARVVVCPRAWRVNRVAVEFEYHRVRFCVLKKYSNSTSDIIICAINCLFGTSDYIVIQCSGKWVFVVVINKECSEIRIRLPGCATLVCGENMVCNVCTSDIIVVMLTNTWVGSEQCVTW